MLVMVSIISIGIKKYHYTQLDDIDCASADSKKIYDAFKHIMENDFSEHTSVCLTDLTANSFVSLLNSFKFLCQDEKNILVVYFSGHAKTLNKEYILCFSDYNEENNSGYVSIGQMDTLLNAINCEIIIILDCCFSGYSLRLASQSDIDKRISILTSNTENGLAKYDHDGSKFTKCICESIFEIKAENTEFTLNILQNKINSKYSDGCFNMGASRTGDIMLKQKGNFDKLYYDFNKRFIRRISQSDRFFREASWYSLSGLPFQITEKVYTEIFKCFNSFSNYPLEASWLVRRAIGSSISCIESKNNRLFIAKQLIESPYWQEQCIGIIGARYDIVNDINIFNLLIEKVLNKRITKIDALWLANLYAAENKEYNYKIFLDTDLAIQPWGIQEICKAASHHGISDKDFSDSIESETDAIATWKEKYYRKETNKSELYHLISTKESRGRLPKNSSAKFILSTLYGNWRGNKILNLENYIESQNRELIPKELNEAANFIEVEFRMAIYEYFLNAPKLLKKYKDCLLWGLRDKHPWVRRVAIQAFKSAKINQDICNESIIDYFNNEVEHIGEFDLILEYSDGAYPQNSKILELVKKNNRFTNSDLKSLTFGLFNCIEDKNVF